MSRSWRTALLALFALSLAVAQASFYAERNLFDADRFADHVESALGQPDVRREAGAALSREIIRAEPDLIALEPIVRSASEAVVGSGGFRAVVRAAAYKLHNAVFGGAEDNSVALTVSDAGVLVIQALQARDPEAAAKIPEGVEAKLTAVSEGDFGEAVTDLVQIAENVEAIGWIALVLAVASFTALVFPKAGRRDAARALGYTLAAVGVLMAVGLEVGKSIVSAGAPTDQAEGAVREIWDEFLGGLLVFNVALAASGLVVVSVADARGRALTPLERARALAAAVAATPARPWLRALRAAGLAAAGLFLVLSPDAALRLVAFAAGLLLIAVAADEVMAMAGPPPERGKAPRREGRRRLVAVAVLGALALALPLAAIAAKDGPVSELVTDECNGSVSLCDRRVDAVAIPATHNSMSSPDGGFLFPDQQSGIAAQLEGGIRGLLIDTHMGVRTRQGVYTVLERGGKSREKIETAVGPAATKTAERLRERIGFRGGADARVYLCHGFCELGATAATDELRDIRDFLTANPGEVLVISIEDQVTPEATEQVFRDSGLLDLVWTGPISPMPTLGEMVERNRRVLVFGEEDVDGVPWFHQQFDFVKETPFDVPTAAELLSPAACRLNRGKLENPVVLLNHWVAQTPPRASTARRVNGAKQLVARANTCEKIIRGLPGLIAVDLWKEGDVVGAARALNR